MTKDFLLENKIGDMLLDFSDLHDEVTRGDLQGIASVRARDIIQLIKEEYGIVTDQDMIDEGYVKV